MIIYIYIYISGEEGEEMNEVEGGKDQWLNTCISREHTKRVAINTKRNIPVWGYKAIIIDNINLLPI